jgi:hypothetical protein
VPGVHGAVLRRYEIFDNFAGELCAIVSEDRCRYSIAENDFSVFRHFQDSVGSRLKEVPVAAIGLGGYLIPHYPAYSKA